MRSTLLEAPSVLQPNYEWMSVIDSRACWNIGNGQRVKMLGDNWFLGQTEFEVWSPASTLVIRLIEDDANNGNSGIGYGDSSCGPSIPSSSKLLIKGGTVVNAHHQQIADVYIEDGVIVVVNPTITVGDEVRVIDATGKFVMPGGIDPHIHLEFEFMNTVTKDDFFSGQAAALAGGTTMHIDFAIPIDGSLTAGFEAYEKKAKKSCMDYGFHMAITKWDETVAREMELMVKEKGINYFKFFMAYKGAFMIGDELLLQGLKKCKSLGALAMVHAENGDAVDEGQKKMIELGITGPEGHALSRPPVMPSRAYVSQFSADGSLFVAGFQGNIIKIYNVDKGWKVQKNILTKSLRWTITDTSLSPDQRNLVYASMSPIVHIVNVGSSETESLANVTEIHDGLDFSSNDDGGYSYGIFSVKFSTDGWELVAGTSGDSRHVYDLEANKVSLQILAHAADVNTVCFADETGHLIYSGSDDSPTS
ncbi:hypothetical protein KIW84_075972 [Lathyrus oleraceus]|uniref:dihydropyrimidinase n=1 Tax=Pisum sativum TaxID=3888 RepID=A0A9D4VWP2_PEA|nr:hypothetical protein KIW84_075972 [Pisum sativum]